MRALVFLFATSLCWSADCGEVWRQIHRNRAAGLSVAGCSLDFYDRLGRTPLIAALDSKADPALVTGLLSAGAKPDFSSRYGNPPLIWAIIAGPAWTRLLLERGAKPLNVLDFSGPLFSGFDVTRQFSGKVPTLYLAAWLQNGSLAELAAKGVRLDPAASALLVDAMTGLRAAELEILLRSGFVVQARNPRGQTLLHEVVRLQKRALIAPLLRHGASARDQNAAGQTVESLARSLGRQAELACLKGAC